MKNKSLVYLFFMSLGILCILDIISEKKTFSELENRYLAKKPKITIEKIFSGQYTKDYEKYVNDNFIGRNYFINLKSIFESMQLKLENNNILYGKNGYMFEKFKSFDTEILKSNVEAIKEFSDKNEENFSLMLVPYSGSILRDYYSIHIDLVNENSIIDEINKYLGDKNSIDVKDTLLENKKSYIYYKTDHHWTTYGAYLAYLEFCKEKKFKDIIDLNLVYENKVEDFLGTFYSKSKLFNAQKDILSYYDMPHLEMKIGDEAFESIYKLENLEKRDKYSVFLDGNHSRVIVKNSKNKNGKKLLVIKDSFANSVIPFIANHYEEVHIIDLRHYPMALSEYMKKNEFTSILCLYSFKNLTEDRTVTRIKF